MPLKDIYELDIDEVENLWLAMRVISVEEFEEKALLAIWKNIKDKERNRVLAKLKREANKIRGISTAKKLSNEELMKELGG